ncbi:MAG TPA: translation initiation factor IF-3 [Candidatus Limnocylindria bacterium]|nr:translation initiation factor IF-3 [Candidatus Limnocylindria bacterium]
MAELRVNDQIKVPTVRLIGANGEQLGIVPTPRALALAKSEGFDLMEIAPTAQPPVARLGDFGKYKYAEQQKLKEAKKKQKAVTWKEIRVAPKIDDHDLDTKTRAAMRFLDEGDRLKVTVRFRGRELAHPERGRTLLLQIAEKLKDHGIMDRAPLLEGRQMVMIMNPSKGAAPAPAPAAPRPAAAASAAGPTPVPARPAPAGQPAAAAPRPAPSRPAPAPVAPRPPVRSRPA